MCTVHCKLPLVLSSMQKAHKVVEIIQNIKNYLFKIKLFELSQFLD